jgi:ankyrin repeat protein
MQAAFSIELDSTDRFGNNDLHTFALKKDFRSLVETAKNNPNLLIQKNQNGQTPLHLIQTMSQSVIANNKKNNIIKNNLLYSLIKINPESLSILDSKGDSLLDLLAVSVNGEDKEFIKKLAELNPSFVENHKFGIELETIQQEFTSIFGLSLGEEDQLPEEQPLIENQNLPSQPSPTLPISQEIKQQKQESSVNKDQKSLNEKLLQACKNDKNMKAVLLVRKGANPNALCQSGESAISYAKTTGNNKLGAELQKEESKKINSDLAPPEVLKDIPNIVPLSENRKEKEPTQEIRRRKGSDEGKIITVNQSIPVFQPKQTSLPKYAAYGGLIGAGLGAVGCLSQ